MSCCLGGKLGEVAETVLLPGDPLRAKYIADNYLKDVICYNEIRGMYGFTGTYKGKRVSVQGTGMGIPSLSIYTYDLIHDHGVKNLIRIGTCGSIQEDVNIRDVILVMGASNDSNITKLEFKGMNFAPTANFGLLKKAYDVAKSKGIEPKVGSVFTSDLFYHDDPELWKTWARFGMLA
ncbi:MAG TPA: purine-nucleoside phosphorylase, partial [Clostridiaceae bacterium]|nr:purine-nucleoside phosphorylase [Clostridiaceae bacterium]